MIGLAMSKRYEMQLNLLFLNYFSSGASGHGGPSPSIPTTASASRTLKRPRDSTAPDKLSVEDKAGLSGYQKEARTLASTEFLQLSSVGVEVVEMGGVSGSQETVESDSSMQVEVGERREVGSSSSQGVDMVGTSGEVAASSGVATSSQEEVLDSEQEGDVEEDGEISEDMEEVEAQDLDTDNLDVGTDEEDENDQEEVVGEVNSEEEIEVEQPEGMVEDNSSEPSSSTGARQVGRGVAGSSLPGPSQGAFDQDQGESDSVVPTTPKLPLPRRNDGFAEAVSSPQVSFAFLVIYQY